MIPQWYDQPVFYFSNAQSLVHGGTDIVAPQGCNELDYELEIGVVIGKPGRNIACLLYTSPSPRDLSTSRMPSSA